FLYAAKKLDLKLEECVVIEDSLSGMKAAKAAGMKLICVASHPGVDAIMCDRKIVDFKNLKIDFENF
ncbi:HAD family phosphatase, partial [Candidatus Micrarchaeota archaeon]|nr:HAD family phosphatase [Candidatus Micrarchaeota archaeon]